MKQANRSLLKSVSRDGYTAIMSDWKAHLRWMHLHIGYFQTTASGAPRSQNSLSEDSRYVSADGESQYSKRRLCAAEPRELRKMMRLYLRSIPRGRENYSLPFMLNNFGTLNAIWHLARFVLRSLPMASALEVLRQCSALSFVTR